MICLKNLNSGLFLKKVFDYYLQLIYIYKIYCIAYLKMFKQATSLLVVYLNIRTAICILTVTCEFKDLTTGV